MTINWNGKRRWIALLLLIAGFGVMFTVPPVIPVIQLPGEVYPESWTILGLRVTNTFVSSVIVWILLVLLALYVSRAMPKGSNEVPRGGFYNIFEMLFEGLYNFVAGIAGEKYLRYIFSFFMTIFLIVLLSNWQSIIPGVDSIGFLHPRVESEVVLDAEGNATTVEVLGDGYDVSGGGGLYNLNPRCPWVSPEAEAEADAAAVANADAAAIEARGNASTAILLAEEAGRDTAGLVDPEIAAANARQEVLDAREAEKQARRNAGCVTGIGAPPIVGETHEEEAAETETVAEATTAAEVEGTEVAEAGSEEEAAAEGEAVAEGEHAAEGEHVDLHHLPAGDPRVPWVVTPFVRPASTDLNMTVALALVSVVATQVLGFRALGPSYLTKFFNFKTLLKSPLGGIDVAVGLLELIGEFARILSFAFRLLGNVFAGSVLLFVMSFLIPFLPWPFFLLEFGVGALQAYVFALLTAIFMSLATVGHHGGEHGEEHGEAHGEAAAEAAH